MLAYLVPAVHPVPRCTRCASSMCAADSITTLCGVEKFEQVIKKSRFIGIASPVQSSAQALEFVREHADPKARHNCFAWRLADGATRTNGDGEPGGTAGPPILAAITGAGLHNVAVLVQRHRLGGGAKLGTGGLVRAYGGTAVLCLEQAETLTVDPLVLARVRYGLEDTGAVFSALGSYSPRMVDPAVDSDGTMEAEFEAPPHELERIVGALRSATQGRVSGLLHEGDSFSDAEL
jgi:putative IMPACT (imprinted ancient) family translation regulator